MVTAGLKNGRINPNDFLYQKGATEKCLESKSKLIKRMKKESAYKSV